MRTDREIVVFLGPTLPTAEASELLDATYLPPVEQGDVAAAVERRPEAIVIIDGYFGWVPSVWHKEILWALSEGIPVLGASSMGALRAAELHLFGMVGHGRVFTDFVEGRLHDDDEVAVAHAGAEHGFRALSDAMVNVRATLDRAAHDGIVSRATERRLIGLAKATYFPDRSLVALVDDARAHRLISSSDGDRLSAWLLSNRIDVKADDARGLLRRVAAGWRGAPPSSGFTFQPTVNWLQLLDVVRGRSTDTTSTTAVADHALAECRLSGQWPAVEAMALVRLLVSQPATGAGRPTDEEFTSELARLCIAHDLAGLEDVPTWLLSTGWDAERLARVLEREALTTRVRAYNASDLHDVARELLVVTGTAPKLAARGRRKQAWLATVDRATTVFGDATEAISWFRALVGSSATESDDLLAQRHGWLSAADMTDDLLCEWAFRKACPPSRGDEQADTVFLASSVK